MPPPPSPPPPPPPKHREKEEHGVVTRGSSRSHGAESRGSSRPRGAESRGSSRPRRDRPDSQGLGTKVQSSTRNFDGTHRTPDGMSSSTGALVLQKHRGVRKVSTSSSRVPQDHSAMVKVGTSLSGEMSQKFQLMVKGGTSSNKCRTMAEQSISSSRQMSQKCHTMVKGGTSSKEMSQKCSVKMKAGLSFPQKNRLDEKARALSTQEPALAITKPQALGQNKEADEAECATQQLDELALREEKEADATQRLNELALRRKKEADEAEQAIQQLNQLGLGEEISHDQYLIYLGHLPCQSPDVDTSTKLHGTQLVDLEIRLALHRLKCAKGENARKLKENCPPCLEKNFECSGEGDIKLLGFLEEQGFFKHFEKDGTLDWSFHPDSYSLAGLDDYQRIVPKNHGGFEYVNWDEYRRYYHSYDIENEYINYCGELAEKLKWMEDYVGIKLSPFKRIFTRGAYQATKIATGFPKITWSLASNGYHELLDNMSFDVLWYKELDGVYFEIWQLIAKQKKCFRDALDEVCKLNKFPLRQPRMKRALDTDCSKMEEEFRTCTKGITGDVMDEKAHDLIAEAVKKLREKPKFYEHYIKKKIDIARAIGVIA